MPSCPCSKSEGDQDILKSSENDRLEANPYEAERAAHRFSEASDLRQLSTALQDILKSLEIIVLGLLWALRRLLKRM